MARKQPPKRGDLVKITWVDCTEDPVGNPNEAKCIERVTFGLFWSATEDMLVTTTTIDSDGPHQQGWCAYPIGMVTDIRVIKRAKQ